MRGSGGGGTLGEAGSDASRLDGRSAGTDTGAATLGVANSSDVADAPDVAFARLVRSLGALFELAGDGTANVGI